MRQNVRMKDNFRVFFSIIWLIATTLMVATGFIVLLTWGEYLPYFYTTIVVWCIATIGAIVTAV